MNIRTKPAIGSRWQHKNGNIYIVYDYTNIDSTRADYPERISYRNEVTNTPYSRDLADWHRSMTLLP